MKYELPQVSPSEVDGSTFEPMPQLVEVTQSAMGTYLNCQQRFALRYLYHLRRRGFVSALATGTAVHAGLEVLMTPTRNGIDTPQRLPEALAIVDNHFAKISEDATDMAMIDATKLQTAWAQASAIVEAWAIVNAQEVRTWEVKGLECVVRAHPEADTSWHYLDRGAGKLDGLVIRNGQVLLLERKTRRSLSDFDIMSLPLNMQLLWYAILSDYASRSAPEGTLWQPTHGALYDVIAKPQHKLTAKGQHDLQTRMRDAMLADPDRYFCIAPVEWTEGLLDRAYVFFERLVASMDTLARGNIVANKTRCDDYGGCPYKALCLEGADANDPRTVFDCPSIFQYEFVQGHSELESNDGEVTE